MKRIKFILLSDEEEYSVNFAKYVSQHYTTKVSLSVCDDLDAVEIMEGAGFDTDILLVSEDLFAKIKQDGEVDLSDYARDVWVLSSGKYLEISEITTYDTINRHLSIKEIIDTILERVIEKGVISPRLDEKEKDAYVVAMSTVADVDGCVHLSYDLATKYANSGNKVLLVSMENYCVLDELCECEIESGLFSELNLLVDLTENVSGKDLLFNLEESICEMGNLDILALSRVSCETYKLKSNQYKELIEAINLLKRYDYIVLSCGDMLTPVLFEVLKFVDKYLMIAGETKLQHKRMEIVRGELEDYLMMDFKKKSSNTKLFEIKGDRESLVDQAVMICG